MKPRTDILIMGSLLAFFLAALTSASRSSPPFPGECRQFPKSYLLTAPQPSLEPVPATYREMGRLGRILVGQHRVRSGETLSDLAKKYGSQTHYLRSTNRLESSTLESGRLMMVHNGLGMLHQVRESNGKTETLERIAQRYNSSALKIAKANHLPGVALLSPSWVQPGALLFIPNASLRFTDYLIPVGRAPGKRFISSAFGMRRHPIYRYRQFHKGLDMPRPHGFPVRASRDGIVIFSGWRNGYGRLIIIKHREGVSTWYGHLSHTGVSSGKRVKMGQFIGRVGSSGLSTGPHLHFEVRDRYGRSLNPKKFLF